MRRTALISTALVAAVAAISFAQFTSAQTSGADWWPKWTADGQLELPKGYHRWVYLGSPLTPHGLNDGKAGFPEFHNVYIQHQALDDYLKTGVFPEGTIMFKELQLTLKGEYSDGSRNESSGRGYFPGAPQGADVSVKDSGRCASTNNWCYFNFGHHAPPYAATARAAAKTECAFCHEANAQKDMVFTQFYPLLQTKK